MASLSGEINEYMKHAQSKPGSKYSNMSLSLDGKKSWFLSVQSYLTKWVDEHKDGQLDMDTLVT